MTSSTCWAREAANSSASARPPRSMGGSVSRTRRRISSPKGVEPGSRVVTTSQPPAASTAARRGIRLDLPEPSGPSRVMKMPLAGSTTARVYRLLDRTAQRSRSTSEPGSRLAIQATTAIVPAGPTAVKWFPSASAPCEAASDQRPRKAVGAVPGGQPHRVRIIQAIAHRQVAVRLPHQPFHPAGSQARLGSESTSQAVPSVEAHTAGTPWPSSPTTSWPARSHGPSDVGAMASVMSAASPGNPSTADHAVPSSDIATAVVGGHSLVHSIHSRRRPRCVRNALVVPRQVVRLRGCRHGRCRDRAPGQPVVRMQQVPAGQGLALPPADGCVPTAARHRPGSDELGALLHVRGWGKAGHGSSPGPRTAVGGDPRQRDDRAQGTAPGIGRTVRRCTSCPRLRPRPTRAAHRWRPPGRSRPGALPSWWWSP